MTQLEMLADRVLVQPIDPDEKTEGGVVLPDCARFGDSQEFVEARRGRVVAIGSGTRLESGETVPVSVKVGDDVLWRTKGDVQGVREVRLHGETYFAMPETQLLCVLEAA